ncbi:DUF4129 domain-containing protein [Paenibacillus glycanilyticus]|uniref:Protein-glutamine gamma-glutamyltransferase-like C-terminal domain-containing protein n=1 Tax=Paenibacillus glycanilyticus TaxID=126569 RepID=A0ABQ6GAV1_9BACL|nr:DUF4129 domain-containing protein [Paenibacillus glycanilyticus]GLX68079.1 hypothetical protein MU1_24240 [Paenibacillus glycanilyticus]
MSQPSANKSWLHLFHGSVETLFALPIWFVALFFATTDAYMVTWLLTVPLIYLAGALWITKITTNRRIYRFLLGMLLGAVHTVALYGVLAAFQADLPGVLIVVPFLLSAFTATRGMGAASRSWYISFPNTVMFAGVLLYVVLTIVAHLQDKLQPYFTFLTICGVAAIILMLYLVNERLLSYETQSGGAIQSATTKVFKRQNRFMLTIVAVLLLIAGLFRQLEHSINSFFHAVIDKIMEWMKGSGDRVEETPTDPMPPQSGLPPVEHHDPPAWLQRLELVAKDIGIAILIIGIAVLLFFIGRKLYKLISKALGRFWERAESGKENADGYTDEVESLADKGKWSNRLRKTGKKRKEAKWEELSTAGERMRYVYRKYVAAAIGKGYEHKPHYTAKETTTDILTWNKKAMSPEETAALARLYDEARYGGQEPKEELVQSLKKRLDELGK